MACCSTTRSNDRGAEHDQLWLALWLIVYNVNVNKRGSRRIAPDIFERSPHLIFHFVDSLAFSLQSYPARLDFSFFTLL